MTKFTVTRRLALNCSQRKEEMIIMEKVIEHSARAVESFIESSRFDHVMNEFNGEVK